MLKRKSNKEVAARGYWCSVSLSGVFGILFLIGGWYMKAQPFLTNLMNALSKFALLIFTVCLLFGFLKWVISYRLLKYGLKRSIWAARTIREINRQLGDAQIGVVHNDILKLPRLKFRFTQDQFLVQIKNSIKYNDKFKNFDISAALSGYVVESSYFSDDRRWLFFECTDASSNFGYSFESLTSFEQTVKCISDYDVLIDKRLTYRLHHSLIVGQTGSGKSYALYSFVLQGLIKGWQQSIVDPKNSSMANIGELVGESAASKQEIIELLDKFFSSMTRRKKELKEKLKMGLDKDYSDFGLKPHVLIFDEFASFQSQLKAEKKDTRDKVQGQIEAIILEGRQLGFFVILAMQKSDATTVNTLIRDNLVFKCVLGSSEQQTYITTFGNADIPQQKMGIGKGVYTLSGVTNKPQILNMPELKFDLYEAFKELVRR